MPIFEQIQRLCSERGIAFFSVEKACGLSNGALNKWKTTSPSIDKVAKLANFLNVSLEYLVNGTELVSASNEGIKLTPEEADMLARYRQLNSCDKVDISESIDIKLSFTFTKPPIAGSSTSLSGDGGTDDRNAGGATA